MFRDYVKQNTPRLNKILIASFHPWLYEDPGALIVSFFGTIAAELGKDEKSPWKQAEAALKSMGIFLTVASKGISLFGMNIDGSALKDAITVGAEAFKETGELSSGLAGLAELADGGERNLEQYRTTVETALKGLGNAGGRIIVLIDDVDRLNKTELLSLLRLIRTVADLPYVTLVIAMDDGRVRDVLKDATSEGYGQGYLDKIIQVPLHVPSPERHFITNELVAQLRSTFKARGRKLPDELEPNPFFEQEALRLLSSLIRTPRDLARYINGVRMLLLAGEDPDVYELDAAFIEALHIFYPDVYERVRHQKRFLTTLHQGRPDHGFMRSRDPEKDEADRTAILDLIVRGGSVPLDVYTEETIRQLLGLLFGVTKSHHPPQHDPIADAALRRIRSHVAFDNYFRGAPTVGTYNRSQVDALFTEITKCAQNGSTSEIAKHLTFAFSGLEDTTSSQLIQDLGHKFRALDLSTLRTLGAGLTNGTELLPPDVVRELLGKVLDATTDLRSMLTEQRDENTVKQQAVDLLLSAVNSSISLAQIDKLLGRQEQRWLPEKTQPARVEWLRRVEHELRSGDPLANDEHSLLFTIASIPSTISKLGAHTPFSIDHFHSLLHDYINRIPKRLLSFLSLYAFSDRNGLPKLLGPQPTHEEKIKHLRELLGDYSQLKPAYSALHSGLLDDERYSLILEDFGTLILN
jgi:hypothetical protein